MIEFRVAGTPGPQGSKSFKGMFKSKMTGKMIPILAESSAKVKPWREAVKAAACEAMEVAQQMRLDGPVALLVVFWIARPKKYTNKPNAYPASRPDLDKYLRSTKDALKDAGVYRDDGQVVDVVMRKRFHGDVRDTPIGGPGAFIRVMTIEEVTQGEQK